MKQNKKIGLIFAFILIAVLLSNFAFARTPGEIFTDSLISMNNFFENESYKPFSKLIDFVFFSIVFMSLFTVGAKKVFSEYTKPIQVIVILFGLALALVFVLADISFMNLFKYAWYILYILLFGLLYYMLGKLGMKNWFGKFLLALLIILAIILLISGLNISEGQTYFNSLSNKFKGIEIPDTSKSSSAFGDLFEEADTTTTTSTGSNSKSSTTRSGSDSKGIVTWANSIYVVLGIVALLSLRRWGPNRLRAKKHRKKPDEKPETPLEQAEAAVEDTPEERIKSIIEKIRKLWESKNENFAEIRKIKKKKQEKLNDLVDAFKVILTPENLPYLFKKGEGPGKELENEDDDLIKLIRLEHELQKKLIELKRFEDDFRKSIIGWEEKLSPLINNNGQGLQSEFNDIFNELVPINKKFIGFLYKYFYLEEATEKKEERLEKLVDPDVLEKNISVRWWKLKKIKENELKQFFDNEIQYYDFLKEMILRQVYWLRKLVYLLNILLGQEVQKENAREQEGVGGSEEELKQESQITNQEENANVGENQILDNIYGNLEVIGGNLTNSEVVFEKLTKINASMKNLSNLKDHKIKIELKRELLKNYKNEEIRKLINDETRYIYLLQNLINEIGKLLESDTKNKNQIIKGVLNRAKKVTDGLIKIISEENIVIEKSKKTIVRRKKNSEKKTTTSKSPTKSTSTKKRGNAGIGYNPREKTNPSKGLEGIIKPGGENSVRGNFKKPENEDPNIVRRGSG